jgi:polyhydroxyalkanoate synthesis repressor PhaR
MPAVRVIKKYSNRRLYDTDDSRYITLEELAERIRAGHDVQVLDAKTSADLTQATLAQIIMESRGGSALLPVALLLQLIRLGDDALAEFFGRWVSFALEAYVSARQSAQAAASLNPLSQLMPSAFSRLWPWGEPSRPATPSIPAPASPPSEVAELRRDLERLRKEMRKKKK